MRIPMLDIHWLHTFVTLARLQHFGQTATELHMTQPNAGERLLQSAERAIAELQLCQSDLNALNQLSQGTLAIAASDIISRLLLIQPFQRFKQEFPGIDPHPARAKAGESDPLDEPTLILLGHDTRTRALIDPSLPLLGLPSCRIMEVGSVDAQLDWAEAGFRGWPIVPDFSIHPRLKLTAPVTRPHRLSRH
ncbi:UNVERIFIED_CONTAM: hypothetical protein K2H54_000105 [Gekko kuhli]